MSRAVLGANGQLGQRTVDEALRRGHQLTVRRRFTAAY